MKSSQVFLIIVAASVVFAVVAEAFGYGFKFAVTTFAMQIPLLVVILLFARSVARSGRKVSFAVISLVLAALFVASGIEDISLCLRFGVMHESDAGLAQIGVALISLTLFAAVAIVWAFSPRRAPNQSPEPTTGSSAPDRV